MQVISARGCGIRPSSNSVAHGSRRQVAVRSSKGDQGSNWFKDFLDFESWAPRSSRFWRLNQYDYEASTRSDEEEEATAQGIAELEARVARQRAAASASASAAKQAESAAESAAELPVQGSFSDADDDTLSSALSQRIAQMSGASLSSAEEVGQAAEQAEEEGEEEEAAQEPLTGDELRLLVYTKYSKTHDVSIVKRDIPGRTFVCLNIMWSHLEQRSFKLTEEQYMEKLESVAYLLNSLGQAEHIRSTLRAPARSQHGMPSRPVVGTAVTIQLQLSQATIDEWFGKMG